MNAEWVPETTMEPGWLVFFCDDTGHAWSMHSTDTWRMCVRCGLSWVMANEVPA